MQLFRALIILTLSSATMARAELTVTAKNPLPFARPSETIELNKADLAPLNAKSLREIHVTDASGKNLIVQPVDTNFDDRRAADIIIFQSNFGPNETKTFKLSTGKPQVILADDYKAYGRFNRERFDDYAWENDRIAHRTYGKALQTWKLDPLTSSAIDIWSKRTPKMVIDRWYMHGDYHTDHGEGADYYSAGPTAGNGAAGIWANDKVHWPANYVHSRTLASGPIRVLFELDYDTFDAGGRKVAAVRRTQLDAGHNLNHITMTFRPEKPGEPLTAAVGLKKTPSDHHVDFNQERGTLTKFEDVEKKAGQQGLAIIIDDPALIERQAEDERNVLILAKVPENNRLSYRAGFYWDKSGQFDDYDAWKTHIERQAQGIDSPIAVTIENQ